MLAGILGVLQCSSRIEPPATVSHRQLEQMLAAIQTPAIVLLWADWSRSSVELLPTAGELAAEYEGRGLTFVTVCLGDAPSEGPQRLLAQFPVDVRQVILDEEPTFALARYGVQDVPAALGFGPGGEMLFALQTTEHSPLTPAELADAIESLIAPPR